jgi:hypothetical protein
VPKYLICQVFLFGYCLPFINIYGQGEQGTSEIPAVEPNVVQIHTNHKKSTVRFVFYNVENLFHPSDDSIKIDEAFTPGGQYYWTYKRYYSKINKLGKLFVAIGEGNMPAIIGLCEIENHKVIHDILNKSVMKYCSYKAIHKESPDLRGIDVALLYDPLQFKAFKFDFIRINDSRFPDLKTRDILHVSGILFESILCHVFINHWPSRRGGQMASEVKRIIVAKKLKQVVDSLFDSDPASNIIIMGDFNDEPINSSLAKILKAGDPQAKEDSSSLINLMYPLYKKGSGTHFRVNNITEASVLDQIIVSSSISYGENGLKLLEEVAHIYKNEVLINKKNGRPLRTYQGLKYLGGFSDHLPVYADFQMVIK